MNLSIEGFNCGVSKEVDVRKYVCQIINVCISQLNAWQAALDPGQRLAGMKKALAALTVEKESLIAELRQAEDELQV